MPQSYVQIWLHIIFSTKHRKELLLDLKMRKEMHAYLAGACKALGSPSRIVGGTSDHVHALCCLSKTRDVADLVGKIKRSSSVWIKEKYSDHQDFYWQDGYGAFSVSASKVDQVFRYIKNQEKHHAKMGFKEEFIVHLKKYRIDYNEQYLWE